MKKSIFSILFMLSLGFATAQTKHVITNAGNIYTPDSIMVQLGDTVEFNVGAVHPTLEVDQNTWAANGTTPLGGGFNYPSGQGSFVVSTQKTYYYICTAHASLGMKGRIFVQASVDIEESRSASIDIFPNPVTDVLHLSLEGYSDIDNARIVDMSGKILKTIDIKDNQSLQKFDVSSLKSGNYILLLQANNRAREFRFVKK